MISLIKWCSGYVRISIVGGYPERFFHLCANNKILLWDLEQTKEGYEVNLSLNVFRNHKSLLISLIRRTKVRIVIVEKKGLPIFLYRNRYKKIFVLGIFLCCFLVYYLSLYVWQIDLCGNLQNTDDMIYKKLREYQVYHGMKKKDVDCSQIEKDLRAEYDNIIWVSAKLEGTKLTIDVQENTDLTVKTEEYQESSIYSNKDAVITSIITRQGTPMVVSGDEVKKGDILVDGGVYITDDGETVVSAYYVAADADIYGETEYEYQDEFLLKNKKFKPTGNSRKSYYLKIFDKSITIGRIPKEYGYFAVTKNISQVKLNSSFYLPFYYGKIQITEQEIMTEKFTENQAKQKAEEKLSKYITNLQQKGVQIRENNVTIEVDEKKCKAFGSLKVIEKIGVRKDVEKKSPEQVEEITEPNRNP